MQCDACGNDYDKTFKVIQHDGRQGVFDCFECAIHKLAPECAHCGCRIIGHGIEAPGEALYCCAHCAEQGGVHAAVDRVR